VRCCKKKFTFAISSPDEFLLKQLSKSLPFWYENSCCSCAGFSLNKFCLKCLLFAICLTDIWLHRTSSGVRIGFLMLLETFWVLVVYFLPLMIFFVHFVIVCYGDNVHSTVEVNSDIFCLIELHYLTIVMKFCKCHNFFLA